MMLWKPLVLNMKSLKSWEICKEIPCLCRFSHSQIINKYKYDVLSYEDLIEEVEENHDFQRIKKYVKERYDKDIVFHEKYEGNLEEIVYINHQLTDWRDLDDLLTEIITYDHVLLDEVLSPNSSIEIGSD